LGKLYELSGISFLSSYLHFPSPSFHSTSFPKCHLTSMFPGFVSKFSVSLTHFLSENHLPSPPNHHRIFTLKINSSRFLSYQ
jgi:hypothetical protein